VEILSKARGERASARSRARTRQTRPHSFARTPTAIVALDVPTTADAVALLDRLGELCRFYKVGSELFTVAGPAIVDYLRARGCDVFLDLKLHDIPNTVRRGSAAAAALGVRFLTVHAAGGGEMLRAAVAGAHDGAARQGTTCEVFAVTILTSLDAAELSLARGRAVGSVEREVLRLADVALQSGASGIVCGGSELAAVRRTFGDDLQVLVPGVRLAGSPVDDQARTITPRRAAELGADFVVLGRTVTQSEHPEQALDEILTALTVSS
jgi:orotidine-5'-phosphate decarboxylase